MFLQDVHTLQRNNKPSKYNPTGETDNLGLRPCKSWEASCKPVYNKK